jgi:hypothetical protein
MLTPADFGARPGDVAHVRSSTLFAWAIRRALHETWGNHDGIVVYRDERWGVAEALPTGYVVTPWGEYMRSITKGRVGVAFLRPVGCPEHISHVVMMNALELADAKVRYDWRAIAEIWAQTVLKASIPWQREWAWYCTEAVRACYCSAGTEWDVWRKELPTPYTTEKRHQEGALALVGGIYDGLHYTGSDRT